MTDYKVLCARLCGAIAATDNKPRALDDAYAEAVAALAEPEAEGPRALELEAIELALWDKHRTKGWGGAEFMYDNNFSYALEEYRAALARWGHPTPQPVAVSERLPGPEDCDEQGRCWLGGRQMGRGTPTWLLGYPAWAERFPDVHRFWLPAHALPTPEATNE